MELLTFLIKSLATWRICSLLIREGGPGDILSLIRYKMGVRYDEQSEAYATNIFSMLFTCIWCLSVWVGIVLSLDGWVGKKRRGLIYMIGQAFALSAMAIWLDKQIK